MSIYKIQKAQKGFILIICLFMLLVVAMLGIFGMRNVVLGEKVAGNTLEKQRALQAAESAIRYGEWWLSRNNLGNTANCTTTVNGNTLSLMRVCQNKLLDVNQVPWPGRTDYKPASMVTGSAGGLAASGDINYRTVPQLYIHFLGSNRRGDLYEVSGAGYAGNANTVAVVQSTFAIGFKSINLGGL